MCSHLPKIHDLIIDMAPIPHYNSSSALPSAFLLFLLPNSPICDDQHTHCTNYRLIHKGPMMDTNAYATSQPSPMMTTNTMMWHCHHITTAYHHRQQWWITMPGCHVTQCHHPACEPLLIGGQWRCWRWMVPWWQWTMMAMVDNNDNEGWWGMRLWWTTMMMRDNRGHQWWQHPLPASSAGGLFIFLSIHLLTDPLPCTSCEVGGVSFLYITLHTCLLTGPCLWGDFRLVLCI
jgi:hypothetical protein